MSPGLLPAQRRARSRQIALAVRVSGRAATSATGETVRNPSPRRLQGVQPARVEYQDAIRRVRGHSRVSDKDSGTGGCFDLRAQQTKDMCCAARLEIDGPVVYLQRARTIDA